MCVAQLLEHLGVLGHLPEGAAGLLGEFDQPTQPLEGCTHLLRVFR